MAFLGVAPCLIANKIVVPGTKEQLEMPNAITVGKKDLRCMKA